MTRGKWIKGSWSSLRDERVAPDERLYIHEVADLVGRDRRTVSRWGLSPIGKEGRWNIYSRREALQMAAMRDAMVERKPTRIDLRESHAVSLFRRGLSIDEVAQKAALPTSYAAEIHGWWQMASQLVTYRKETVVQANRLLSCAPSQEIQLHLGLHVPQGKGLFPMLIWVMDGMASAPRVARERAKLVEEAGMPLFEDAGELEAWLDSVEKDGQDPSVRGSQPRLHHARVAGDGKALSPLVKTEEAARMLQISDRDLRRISKRPDTPLPKRRRPGDNRRVYYSRADIIAYLYRSSNDAAPVVLEGRAADAAVLFGAGVAVDEALVELRVGCDQALRLYADWAEFHVACVEGRTMRSLLATFKRRGLTPPHDLLHPEPDARDTAMLSLVRSAVRHDRLRAELAFQASRIIDPSKGEEGEG